MDPVTTISKAIRMLALILKGLSLFWGTLSYLNIIDV